MVVAPSGTPSGGELGAGFLIGRQRRANEAELEAFLSNPVVEEVPVDIAVARLYAEILTALRKAGTPIPTNDIWVAATAAQVGATVLSADRHFEAVKRIGSLVLGSSADAQDWPTAGQPWRGNGRGLG